ncbi:DUF5085 family protein [Bacillus sp. 1NLA3E]|uniref:DUF5085 family protein n=1 Tax=Bacillus sp. 1NLA3E TaxID=666686 RepID=UPI000247ECD2|nr:DUF5085 family protein [Bacillus sp. 1NLA3E]AGK55706.1 hypothetical protein B1NLA3E_19810 [Bacillus sp. 1NLA3E]
MKIKRCPIIFNNVISTKSKCRMDKWYLIARDLRNAVIKNGLYATGPVIYQINKVDLFENEAEYTFYLPINEQISMTENDKYSFQDKWSFGDALVYRHADLEEDINLSYNVLRVAAKDTNLVLQEPFFHIYLDVYGEGIIDIFAPIVEEG